MVSKNRRSTNSIKKTTNPFDAFVHPVLHSKLLSKNGGLMGDDGLKFPFITNNIIDFLAPYVATDKDFANLSMYDSPEAIVRYRNYLDWMFATFNENETNYRNNLLQYLNLTAGDKVLIVSVGLGDDIPIIKSMIGPTGYIHAQDISRAMVLYAAKKNRDNDVMFSVSNGNALPYADGYFDGVFHFGGINLFGDTRKAIENLTRVTRSGGRIVFGDEGIAAHLRGSNYAEVAINNNMLWEANAPIDLLPHSAIDISLNYVLGNCFYVISFTKGDGYPFMDIDIEHKGLRGGSARTRYYGKIEGVTQNTKDKLIAKAKELNISVHDLLEKIINTQI